MSWLTIIGNIGALVAIVGTLFLLRTTGALDVITHGLGWVQSMFSWLMSNRIFAALTFVFLIGLAGFVVDVVLGLNYACTTTNNLRVQKLGAVSGIGMFFAGISHELNASDPAYDEFIVEFTDPTESYSATDYRSAVSVDCVINDPAITVFGIDFLNFQYWVLIMIITAIIGVATKFI